MAVSWKDLNRWSELYLERMEDAGVARVVLNRPDKRNAQTGTLVQAFFEALEIIRADLELKVVITKGGRDVVQRRPGFALSEFPGS